MNSPPVIDKLAWIEIQNHQLLSTRSRGKDTWYIPGGKREGGESDLEALVREIREELSVEISPASAEFVGSFTAQAHGHSPGVEVRMRCYRAQYRGTLRPSSEVEELAWITCADLASVSPVDRIIMERLRQDGTIR